MLYFVTAFPIFSLRSKFGIDGVFIEKVCVKTFFRNIKWILAYIWLYTSHPATGCCASVFLSAPIHRSTSQMKHLTTSQWNIVKPFQLYVPKTSLMSAITTSQEYVTTTYHWYVSTTSQASLKWNSQQRLSGTLPRCLSGTSLRCRRRTFNDVAKVYNQNPSSKSQLKHPMTLWSYISTTSVN